MGFEVLTTEQAEQFIERGFVVIRGCFSPEAAAEYTSTVWTRLGYESGDPATWAQPSIHMPSHRVIDIRDFAPRAWGAVCDLLGGADRVQPYEWNDAFIVNLGEGADQPWQPASRAARGWHKDGDFFRHFLDSPDQGLLTLVLWSDVVHRGGATFVAADSVGPVARFLAEHPEGAYPPQNAWTGVEPEPAFFHYADLIAQCDDFVEATGEVGDVYLLHPFVLHAKAQNVLRRPRFITNPPVHLAEPMRFDRPDPAEFSLVERAVLRGLGVERFEFTPRGPRERVVSDREAMEGSVRQAERDRLADAGLTF